MSDVQTPKRAARRGLINLPATADMTNEVLMSTFSDVEARYKKSENCRDVDRKLREYLLTSKIRIETCVCFGTGTFSGYCDTSDDEGSSGSSLNDKADSLMMQAHHQIAMYQLAAFKEAIDLIDQLQGSRPLGFAQEPQYNDFDSVLLHQLQITKVDSPRGFSLVKENSLTYCPGVPFYVVHSNVTRNPVLNLSGNLAAWSRECWENLPAGYTGARRKEGEFYPHMDDVQMIEEYLATHDVQRVETMEITDAVEGFGNPFWNLRLYTAKSRSRGITL